MLNGFSGCGKNSLSDTGSLWRILLRGVAIFAKAFLGIPAQQAAKITRPLMPAAAPAVLSLSFATQQGDSSHHPNDSTRFRKACIFTTQKTLRENTCPIASGDYSTPVSQRLLDDLRDRILLHYQLPIMELMREERGIGPFDDLQVTDVARVRTNNHSDIRLLQQKGALTSPFFC